MPNFTEIKEKELFVDGQTYGHLKPALLGRLCQRVYLIGKKLEY